MLLCVTSMTPRLCFSHCNLVNMTLHDTTSSTKCQTVTLLDICFFVLCTHVCYVTTIGNRLGNGITHVVATAANRPDMPPIFEVPVPSTVTTLLLTYDKGNITCINLPANILRKTATYSADIFETLCTIKQSDSDSNSESVGIRLQAVSACTIDNSWCIAKVLHGSNDIEIIQVNSDTSMKQLACIKGPAITEGTDVIGAIVMKTSYRNMIVQLIVAYKHDNTMHVYDTVHGHELCKPISIGIRSDTIADIFIDARSTSVFTTSTWLPSVHCWSRHIDARNTGKYMTDVADAEMQTYNKLENDKKLAYDFTQLRACIQQQPPTLLESLELVHWCPEYNKCHYELVKILLDPKLSPLAITGNMYCNIIISSTVG